MSTHSHDSAEKNYLFYPNHMFVEAIAAIAVLLALCAAAMIWQFPLEEMAHPSDTTYIPRPEWYFLFYFQLLKYFGGALTIVGVFVVPLVASVALFLLPFYDRNKETKLGKRPLAAAAALFSIVMVVGLTAQSIVEDMDEPRIKRMYLPPVTAEQVTEGNRIFHTFCVLCHSMDGKGGFMATDMTQIGGRASRTYIENVVLNPQIVNQKTIMSLIPLSDDERHAVSAYLWQKK